MCKINVLINRIKPKGLKFVSDLAVFHKKKLGCSDFLRKGKFFIEQKKKKFTEKNLALFIVAAAASVCKREPSTQST